MAKDIEEEIEGLVEHIDETLGRPLDIGSALFAYEEVKEHCERMIRAIQVDLARDI